MTDIQSPPSKYIANAMAADTLLAPSSIPQLLLLNAGAHIDYSDINIEPSNFVSAVVVLQDEWTVSTDRSCASGIRLKASKNF